MYVLFGGPYAPFLNGNSGDHCTYCSCAGLQWAAADAAVDVGGIPFQDNMLQFYPNELARVLVLSACEGNMSPAVEALDTGQSSVKSRCASLRRRARSSLPEITVTLACFAILAGNVATISIDPDEGYYLALADRMAAGQLPFRQFFSHQLPLYSWILSFFASTPDSFYVARFMSLGCWSLSGLLLVLPFRTYGIATLAKVCGLVFWHFSPVTQHVVQAIPVSMGMLFFVLGLRFFGVLPSHKERPVLAGIFISLSMTFKHIFVVLVFAMLVAGVLSGRRRSVGVVLIAMLGAFAFVFGVSFYVGGDGFAEILRLQLGRLVGIVTINTSGRIPQIPQATSAFIDPLVRWNAGKFDIMAQGYFGYAMLTIYTLFAPWLLRLQRHTARPDVVALASLICIPLGVLVLIFQAIPTWNHYFPVLLVFSVAGISAVPRVLKHYRLIVTAVCLFAWPYAQIYQIPRTLDYFEQADALRVQLPADAKLVSFFPLVDRLAGKETACGLDDPSNTYKNIMGSRAALIGDLQKFVIDDSQLIACINADARIYVYRSMLLDLLASNEFKAYLDTRPDRVIQPTELLRQ